MARVTFGLPVHNGEKHVARAIESLLAQDYGDFELHISDNGSSDATRDICERYAAHDRRVRYHRHATNLGAVTNFNGLFERSSSELFAWAGHDDEWAPTFLSRCVAALDARPDAVLAHTWVRFIDLDGCPRAERADDFLDENTPRPERFRTIVQTWYGVTTIYGLMRSSALRRTRRFVNVLGGDMLLLSELALLGPFVQVREPLWTYRTAGFNQGIEYRNRTLAALQLDDLFANRLPMLRLCLEYLHIIARSDAPLDEQLIMAAQVLRWYPFESVALPLGRSLLRLAMGDERVSALLAALHQQRWYRRLRRLDDVPTERG